MYTESMQQVFGSADADMSSGGDTLLFAPAIPVEIVEFGYIITTGLADAAGGMVIKCDKRPTAGSATDQGDGDLGSVTFTAAQVALATAGTKIGCRLKSPQTVMPGEQASVDITTFPDSGAGIPYIVFRNKPTYRDNDDTLVLAED